MGKRPVPKFVLALLPCGKFVGRHPLTRQHRRMYSGRLCWRKEEILQVLASLNRLITCAGAVKPQQELSYTKPGKTGQNKVQNASKVSLTEECTHCSGVS